MNGFIFSDIAKIAGGLAFFMFGLRHASDGLKRLAGGRMKAVLSILTGNRFLAMVAGVSLTMMLQSSTATTIMLVGLCNVGLLTLRQAAGVAVGNMVGSTIIVQLLAFEIADFALVALAAGMVLAALARHRAAKAASSVLIGFGLIFFGIPLIGQGLEPLHDYPQVLEVLTRFGETPLYFAIGIAGSALFSIITQSSAATMALAYGLVRTGSLTEMGALTFVYGAHVATFVTPLIAALGSPRHGKQVVLFDFGMRLLGLLLFIPFSAQIVNLAIAVAGQDADPARVVAWQHTIFNVGNAMIMLPLLGYALGAVGKILPMRYRLPEGVIAYINPRRPDPPPIALEKSAKEIHRAGKRVAAALVRAMPAVEDNGLGELSAIAAEDDMTDMAYEIITDYLFSLEDISSGTREANQRINLLYMLKDIEHVGDVVSKDIVTLGRKKEELGREFSIEGGRLLKNYHSHVADNFNESLGLILDPDTDLAQKMLDNEVRLDKIRRNVYNEHLEQLRRGIREAHDTSAVYTDLLAALQQVTRYCAEMGETVLESFGDGDKTAAERRRSKL